MDYEPPPPQPTAAGADREVVAAEWRRRTQAEYVSAAITSTVTLWLVQIGAPPDLLRDGLRIVDDELTHSELSAHVMGASGGAVTPPAIDRAALTLKGEDPSQALLPAIVRFFCIGESVAVPLFRMLRDRASVPVARKALDRVMRDEARHRQFGWDVLDWLLLAQGDAGVELVRAQLPPMLDQVRAVYGGGAPETELRPEVEAWGLAPPSHYARTVEAGLAHDVLPRFAARGVVIS